MVNLIEQSHKHLSLRECGGLAKIAKKYHASIKVYNDSNSANAKSILSVLGLGILPNQTLVINISGVDERPAFNEIKKYLRES